MRNKSLILMTICAALSTGLSAQSVYPGQHAGKMKKVTTAPMQVESFDLKDVRLLPSRFRDNMMRDSAWMTSIATNRLLHGFRNNAGVFAGREGGYMTVKKLGGWESLDCELRGHTTGHLLSAYALMYASTGSEIFKLKGDSLVTGLAEVQAALGNGYLSAYPEELINRNIRGTSVWAPWYTLHKLFSGLIDQYLYADNKQALEVVTRMGNWAYNKLKPLDEPTRKRMIRNEFGGVNESFYNLYAITGDERYQWLAEFFYHNDVIDPLKEQRDDLGTKHTNTFIPKVLAEARNYELTRTVETAPSHACRLRTAQRRDVSLYPGERRLRPELLFRLYRLVGPRREERSVCKLALHEHLARIICFICRRRHSCFFGDRKRMA